MMMEQRGSGRTTRQMQEAPQGAVFVSPINNTMYCKDLARHLGRGDLVVVPPSTLERGANWFRGRRPSGVVLDHALEMDVDRAYGWEVARAVIRA